eukprot:GGOE01046859.1.p1 GENE.GGOE01046859.1~~GGOE01046859.1.p1  ORF type:complete len:356 (-),score=73.64 GGOE01046859.1:273-1340(-)
MGCANALRPLRVWLLLFLLSLVPCFVLWPTAVTDPVPATGSAAPIAVPITTPTQLVAPQPINARRDTLPLTKPPLSANDTPTEGLPGGGPAPPERRRLDAEPSRPPPPAAPAEEMRPEKHLTLEQQQEVMAKVQLMPGAEVRRELRTASQPDRGTPEEVKRRLTAYWLTLAEHRGLVSDPMQLYREPTTFCSWSRPNSTFKFPSETDSEHARTLLELLRYVEAVWHQKLGYLYAFADGAYLGAWRHGGLIPHDTDIDIFLFLHANQTRFDFLEQTRPLLPQGAIALHDISRTRHVGERAAHYYPPTRGRLQLVHLQRNASMDISVFTPEKLSNKFSPLSRARRGGSVTAVCRWDH